LYLTLDRYMCVRLAVPSKKISKCLWYQMSYLQFPLRWIASICRVSYRKYSKCHILSFRWDELRLFVAFPK
jgi:hypothetical protein